MSEYIRIVEVGARDGLQNESRPIDTETKAKLVDLLAIAGVTYIEAGSFVSPKAIPQMAGSDQVFSSLSRVPAVVYLSLIHI